MKAFITAFTSFLPNSKEGSSNHWSSLLHLLTSYRKSLLQQGHSTGFSQETEEQVRNLNSHRNGRNSVVTWKVIMMIKWLLDIKIEMSLQDVLTVQHRPKILIGPLHTTGSKDVFISTENIHATYLSLLLLSVTLLPTHSIFSNPSHPELFFKSFHTSFTNLFLPVVKLPPDPTFPFQASSRTYQLSLLAVIPPPPLASSLLATHSLLSTRTAAETVEEHANNADCWRSGTKAIFPLQPHDALAALQK